jgi:SCY1-like protein 2
VLHFLMFMARVLTNPDILPIINYALDSPTHALVNASLGTLPVVLPILDFSTIKNELFPIIAAVFAKTSSMGIKIKGLEALKTLCGGSNEDQDGLNGDGLTGIIEEPKSKSSNVSILDKYTIQEKVVPLLKGIKTKEPAVMMAALEVFKSIGPQVDTDFLAVDVLPILWQFSLGPLLNLPQFQAYMTLIKSHSARIENDQTRKLQELGSAGTASASASRNDFMSFGTVAGANGIESSNGEGDFEALVRGGSTNASGGDMLGGDPWAAATPSASSSASAILPSRTAGHHNRSSNNASPAATFSWSSPPVSPPPTNLAAPRTNSRAITPDNTLSSLNSSFPALTPSNPGIGSPFTSSQQQARPGGMPMNSILAPPNTTSAYASQTTQSAAVDWSKASNAASAHPWANTTSASSNLSSFPMTPASQQGQQQNNPYSAFSIAPPPASGAKSFTIAPPPGQPQRMGSNLSMNSMGNRPDQNQSQRQQTPTQGWGMGGMGNTGGDSLI